MKCQHCEKPATFHITELTGPEPHEVHLCEDHARVYLSSAEEGATEDSQTFAGSLAQQLAVGQTKDDLSRLDQEFCPVCGITFYEFRQAGRLGCPHDYVCFGKELLPLLTNIHGETEHVGKKPSHGAVSKSRQTTLIRLRREMQDAVEKEDYERASELRDQIQQVEDGD